MKTKIYHSVDAALYFESDHTKLMVDGIHKGIKVGMSMMPEEMIRQMEQHSGLFKHLDALLFTHLHPDHFNRGMFETYLKGCSNHVLAYGPDLYENNVDIQSIGNRMKHFRINYETEVYTINTIHDGEEYRLDLHESILLKMDDEVFFICGDAELFPEDAICLNSFCDHIDAVFANVYQIASKTGIECLYHLNPQKLYLYHLPFKENDCWNYFSMTRHSIKRFPHKEMMPSVLKHMSWIED